MLSKAHISSLVDQRNMVQFCKALTMVYNFVLYIDYHALCHKSNVNQRMQKIIDMYKIYFRPYIGFSKRVAIFRGLFSRELQKLLTSNPLKMATRLLKHMWDLKYILCISITLRICWLILDIWCVMFQNGLLFWTLSIVNL